MSLKTTIALFVLTLAPAAMAEIGQFNQWTCIHQPTRTRVEVQRLMLTGTPTPPVTILVGVQQPGKKAILSVSTEETVSGNLVYQMNKGKDGTLFIAPTAVNQTYDGKIKVGGKTLDPILCYESLRTVCGTMTVTNTGGTITYRIFTAPFSVPKPGVTKLLEEYSVTEEFPGALDKIKNNQAVCLEIKDFKFETPTVLRAMTIVK